MIRKFEAKDTERIMHIWKRSFGVRQGKLSGVYAECLSEKSACSGLLLERGVICCIKGN